MKRVKIWVGSDRAGFGLKDGVVKMLERLKRFSGGVSLVPRDL